MPSHDARFILTASQYQGTGENGVGCHNVLLLREYLLVSRIEE